MDFCGKQSVDIKIFISPKEASFLNCNTCYNLRSGLGHTILW